MWSDSLAGSTSAAIGRDPLVGVHQVVDPTAQVGGRVGQAAAGADRGPGVGEHRPGDAHDRRAVVSVHVAAEDLRPVVLRDDPGDRADLHDPRRLREVLQVAVVDAHLLAVDVDHDVCEAALLGVAGPGEVGVVGAHDREPGEDGGAVATAAAVGDVLRERVVHAQHARDRCRLVADVGVLDLLDEYDVCFRGAQHTGDRPGAGPRQGLDVVGDRDELGVAGQRDAVQLLDRRRGHDLLGPARRGAPAACPRGPRWHRTSDRRRPGWWSHHRREGC